MLASLAAVALWAVGAPMHVAAVVMSILVMPVPAVYAHFAESAQHNHAAVPCVATVASALLSMLLTALIYALSQVRLLAL